jgi:hypothetical protein
MKTYFLLALCLLAAVPLRAEKTNPNFLLAWDTTAIEAGGRTTEYTTTTRSYDKGGQLLSIISEADTDGDGTMDRRSSGSAGYDSQGRLATWIDESVAIATGEVLSRSTSNFAYDRRGQLTNAASYSDSYGDGSVEFTSSTSYRYDQQGNIVELHQESHSADYADTMTETRSYNPRGDEVLAVNETKADGRPTVTTWQSWSYGAGGRPSSIVLHVDANGDGLPDPGAVETTYVCAASGLPSETLTRALDADGHLGYSIHETYTYDQHRNTTGVRVDCDDDGDGTIDRVVLIKRGYVHR